MKNSMRWNLSVPLKARKAWRERRYSRGGAGYWGQENNP